MISLKKNSTAILFWLSRKKKVNKLSWYHPKLSYKRTWKTFIITGIIDGHPAKTKAGELSIVPKEIQILAPCMKILPTTGLVDQSFKYRHRHVDLMLNPQVRSIFYTKSKIVNSIRQYLNSEFLNHSSVILEFLGQGSNI